MKTSDFSGLRAFPTWSEMARVDWGMVLEEVAIALFETRKLIGNYISKSGAQHASCWFILQKTSHP